MKLNLLAKIGLISMTMIAALCITSCGDDDDEDTPGKGNVPANGSVLPSSLVSTTLNSAKTNELTLSMTINMKNFESNGLGEPDKYGVCWSESKNPTYPRNYYEVIREENMRNVSQHNGVWAFTYTVVPNQQLSTQQTYYMRAFIVYGSTVYYGETLTFTPTEGGSGGEVNPQNPDTPNNPGTGNLSQMVSFKGDFTKVSRAANSLTLSVDVSIASGANLSGAKCGYVYMQGKDHDPRNGNATVVYMNDCVGTSAIAGTITCLSPKTWYCIAPFYELNGERIYGSWHEEDTKGEGTGSGDPKTAITLANKSVTSNSAVITFSVKVDGLEEPDDGGFCYSTSQNPTIQDNAISVMSYFAGKEPVNGGYTEDITVTGLASKTTYYGRAYLKYGETVYYSNSTVTFTTK